jgi:folylpolyglutamate synthase/dihydropteroate synthase
VLADAVRRVAEANGGETITVFEILTAVMFVLFSEHPADAAIVEVGLGGRFDATNVIAHPAVSVIMSIGLDHQAYLGDRVELIAAEKAGIMKPGSSGGDRLPGQRGCARGADRYGRTAQMPAQRLRPGFLALRGKWPSGLPG